jgi:putative ABC transport system permease protein
MDPLVYLPYRQMPGALMSVIVRTGVTPASLADAFRREIQSLDSDLPIFDKETLAVRFGGNYWFNDAVLFLVFAAIALLLTAVGLYAMTSHSVSQRTQEIGIRMAVGATARDILRLVFRQGAVALGLGLVIGLAGSFAVAPVLRAALVQAPAADPQTLVIAAGVLVLAAVLGCLVPTRRAVRVDPAVALRHE